jgi:hypothetical protein
MTCGSDHAAYSAMQGLPWRRYRHTDCERTMSESQIVREGSGVDLDLGLGFGKLWQHWHMRMGYVLKSVGMVDVRGNGRMVVMHNFQ